MRKLLYILFLIPLLGFAQFGGEMLIVSNQQANSGPVEQYTETNALARVPYEANSTTGLTNQGLAVFTPFSSAPSPQEGGWGMRLEATSQPDRMEEVTSFASGVNLQIKFWGWTESAGQARLRNCVGITDTGILAVLTTTPTEYTINVTTNAASQTWRWYIEVDNVEVYVEGLSITIL